MKENKFEKKLVTDLEKRGCTCYRIESKAGTRTGTPDVLVITPQGTNVVVEVKAGHRLTPNQWLVLKKSKLAFVVSEVPGTKNEYQIETIKNAIMRDCKITDIVTV